MSDGGCQKCHKIVVKKMNIVHPDITLAIHPHGDHIGGMVKILKNVPKIPIDFGTRCLLSVFSRLL